jgi:hypothetical protein
MRTIGAITKINCWELKILCNNQEVGGGEFPTLQTIADELGFTRNIVNEIVNKRRHKGKGKYDTQYLIKKLETPTESLEGIP